MSDAMQPAAKPPVRSTRTTFLPQESFASVADELCYYKQEYQRLKAIIALQKQKIRKLLG